MRNVLRRLKLRFHEQRDEIRFNRPLLLFQSDDWGRVGVRDREGWQELQASGVELGSEPYDFYSLETAEDLQALRTILRKHRDAVGRPPVMGMNFIMANVDFARCFDAEEASIPLVPLSEGLPAPWHRPHLLETYRQGIEEGAFFPALHGLTHFCAKSVVRELKAGRERAQLIRTMWQASTPYIYWRMPWVGYEYWDPGVETAGRFLTPEYQAAIIHQATEIYKLLFASVPSSACAPGYRANGDTRTAWFESGVRVVQNGLGQRKGPYLDQRGMLNTFRTVEIEPSSATPEVDRLVGEAEKGLACGFPAIVSIHAINFHSTIQDFRTTTLSILDEFLSRIEERWPNLLYVHDMDLFRIVTEGAYLGPSGRVEVSLSSTP